jgi:hypothetical protein
VQLLKRVLVLVFCFLVWRVNVGMRVFVSMHVHYSISMRVLVGGDMGMNVCVRVVVLDLAGHGMFLFEGRKAWPRAVEKAGARYLMYPPIDCQPSHTVRSKKGVLASIPGRLPNTAYSHHQRHHDAICIHREEPRSASSR